VAPLLVPAGGGLEGGGVAVGGWANAGAARATVSATADRLVEAMALKCTFPPSFIVSGMTARRMPPSRGSAFAGDNVGVTAPSLESRIDDLYRGPLSEFVSARNTLAKTLAGDEAKRVRALTKPTVVPWAVNQVYWRARPTYDRVIKTGERLREAQVTALEGKKTDVRAATDAHRRAIADAVQEAETIAADDGAQPPRDALMRTFEAISLTPDRAERPGRLTKPLQPAGFEALAGVKVAPPSAPARPAVDPADARKAAAAQKKEEAERKKREAEVKKAEARLERARRQMAEAQAALKRSRDQLS
jgi:hypothetical protein